jgi:actin-related protein 5
MAPSAIDGPVPVALDGPPEREYPPARIYPVNEAKFEKPVAVQVDGRERALAQPAGQAAIVIDNGKHGDDTGRSQ